ncbi:hypothetical protein P167DRAFT_571379 [Morchella conica CCBAS932]|uniref:CBM1 domain-containing protein n=1 Tax=Morchella conica CCBAS932 TaxID=1392247 RepID=A0A3N4L2K1_9PEZI|nr:hypothetical protein P167DRAFT_571379 [Morchella conica CCBAS932]
MLAPLTFVALAIIGSVSAQTAAGYQQCGGVNFSGPTACVSGYHCEKLNDYYSQCLPGSASGTTSVATSSSTTTTKASSTTTGTPTTITTSAGTTSAIASATGAGPGATLLPNYYWIRAVVDPNFHKYLQSSTLRTASDAVLEDASTAGQFNIVNGQLVQLIDTAGTLLYAHVTPRTDTSVTKLLVTWGTTPDTYGTWAFSGDTTTWSTPGITRQNNAAFLVCEEQRVYINLGAYAYMTPAGCADQTVSGCAGGPRWAAVVVVGVWIHYYNGATANV